MLMVRVRGDMRHTSRITSDKIIDAAYVENMMYIISIFHITAFNTIFHVFSPFIDNKVRYIHSFDANKK